MKTIKYDRIAAISYALKWAESRNPEYFNFDNFGGDCTNFVSQCLYAGSKTMNYTPIVGWYYNSAYDRTASWTGVDYLYKFLTTNNGYGPFAKNIDINKIELGEVVELGRFNGDFYHAAIISDIKNGKIYVCAHTFDVKNKPLDSYLYDQARFLHIEGIRTK